MKIHTIEFREVDRARFDEIQNGRKTIETRAGTEKYQVIEVGDSIQFVCGSDVFSRVVAKKYHWPSVETMCHEVSIKQVMPLVDTVEQAKELYAAYPGYLEKIETFGLLGFELE